MLFNKRKKGKFILSTLLIGSIISPTLLWKIVDVLVAILAIINMYALIKLRKEIIRDYKSND